MSKVGPKDYEGSCIACLRGTDTALGFRGPQEWFAAGLIRLGLPDDQAVATVESILLEEGQDPDWGEWMVRVCKSCADKVGMQVALAIVGGALPTYSPLTSA